MYARLWWKEARVFWPIWVAIGVIAAGVQWLLLWNQVREARGGFLIVLGLGWSTLYALAVGAGVLAGEREAKTQVFLDTLPVGRRMLWKAKVSFAVATTLGLTLLLTKLGIMGTAQLDRHLYSMEILLQGFGLVLLEALAWSLLWSVVVDSSLQAAVAGLLTVVSLSMVLHAKSPFANDLLAPLMVPRLFLAGTALGVSWHLFTKEPLPARAGWARQKPALPRSQFGRLIWECVRESRRTWMLLAGAWIGFGLVRGVVFHRDSGLWLVFGICVNGAAAGVSVFGLANRAQTYRFLASHGVDPGRVWKARLLVWSVFTASMVCAAGMLTGSSWDWTSSNTLGPLQVSFLIFEAFVIGVLAGQVVRRGITAWVVATLAFAFLGLPQIALYRSSMIPARSLALFPALVLIISRAWTGDWMNDLRGASRWLRLGGMIGAATVLLVSLYIGYRAWSVPDIGHPFPPRPGLLTPVHLGPDQDAAPDYARLIDESRSRDVARYDQWDISVMIRIVDPAVVANGWDPNLKPVVTWWEARRRLIEPLRRAAAKPEARFPDTKGWTRLDPRISDLSSLLLLLGLDNFERRSRGDLAGAWDDLRAAFQITNQLARSGGYHETSFALTWRTTILQWSLAWAGDSQQTVASLRAALSDRRTLLPRSSLAAGLEERYTQAARSLHRTPATPEWAWWEQVRALRVLRLLYAQQRRVAERDPWQRDTQTHGGVIRSERDGILDADLVWYLVASTPGVQSLPPDDVLVSAHDANILLSRAFEQVAALRIWQLEHGGHYPETLQALVPGILPSLPPDPYSGQPFRYRRSQGQMQLPLGLSGNTGPIRPILPFPNPTPEPTAITPLGRSGNAWPIWGESHCFQQTHPGEWLLYSVGPDRIDNEATSDYQTNPALGDLIFPLPPEPRPQDAIGERRP